VNVPVHRKKGENSSESVTLRRVGIAPERASRGDGEEKDAKPEEEEKGEWNGKTGREGGKMPAKEEITRTWGTWLN